jgi:orotate phosphoribosyltransferase
LSELTEILTDIHAAAEIHANEKGHFVYSGGEHGNYYVDYRPLGRKPEYAYILRRASLYLFRQIVREARIEFGQPITLVGPDTLGAAMAAQVFYATNGELPQNRSLLRLCMFKKNPEDKSFTWSEKDSKILSALVSTETQVIWFDDLLNAGSTFDKTRPMVEALGAKIIGVGVLGNRSGKTAVDLGVKHLAELERFDFDRFPESDCPSCHDGLPVYLTPGHGRRFKDKFPDYPGGFLFSPERSH